MDTFNGNVVMEWLILLLVTPLIIGMLGEVAKGLTKAKPGDKGWKGVYYVTFRAHALVVGAIMGVGMWWLDGPIPIVFGEAVGGYVLAYAFSGGVAMVAYSAIVKTIRAAIHHLRSRVETNE